MVGDILQPTHLLFVLVVALLVLGPKRLPEVGRTLGSGIRDFRQAISGDSANPLHDWSSEVGQSSEPELRRQVPDEADAEATAVAEPIAGSAPFPGEDLSPAATDVVASDTPTAPVVERPAVIPGTQRAAQPARPGSPMPVAGAASQPAPAAPRRAQRPAPAERPAAGTARPTARPGQGARPAARPAPARPVRPAAPAGRPAQPTGTLRPSGGGAQSSSGTPRPAAQPVRAARPVRPARPAARPGATPPARAASAPVRPTPPDDTDA